MSDQAKKTVEEIQRHFKRVSEDADILHKKADGMDKQLAEKIRKVKESSGDVVKHIQERIGK